MNVIFRLDLTVIDRAISKHTHTLVAAVLRNRSIHTVYLVAAHLALYAIIAERRVGRYESIPKLFCFILQTFAKPLPQMNNYVMVLSLN